MPPKKPKIMTKRVNLLVNILILFKLIIDMQVLEQMIVEMPMVTVFVAFIHLL